MYSVIIIAKWFLNHDKIKNISEDVGGISNLKLQKLLYYAQGVYLAIKGIPLFEEPIYAWQHGPVVPCVYEQYNLFGAAPIDFDEDFDIRSISLDDVKILEEVFEIFGQYSAWKLRDMTHEEQPYQSTAILSAIPSEKIKEHFIEKWVTD